MTKLSKWILEYLAKKAVVQGNHKFRIKQYYVILIHAAEEEFTEDSKSELRAFLTYCHEEALDGVGGYNGISYF